MKKNGKSQNKSSPNNKNGLPPRLSEELLSLFHTTPPEYFKRSLLEVFLSYLSEIEQDQYPQGMNEIAKDFYQILKFLDVAEIYLKDQE